MVILVVVYSLAYWWIIVFVVLSFKNYRLVMGLTIFHFENLYQLHHWITNYEKIRFLPKIIFYMRIFLFYN